MRNICGIILLQILLRSTICAQVPLLPNGNFSDYSGTQSTLPGCGYYFNTGQLPPWIRTHGTPGYSNGYLDQGNPTVFRSIRLGSESGSPKGDGIAVNYNFIEGKCYTIKLDFTIQKWNDIVYEEWTPDVARTKIQCYATSGIIAGAAPTDCHEAPPSALPTSTEFIGLLDFRIDGWGGMISGLFSTTRSISVCGWPTGTWPSSGPCPIIDYTPTVDNNQLWINVRPPTGSSDAHYLVWLHSVVITPCNNSSRKCEESLVFSDFEVPAGSYDYARHILAGTTLSSSLGSVSIAAGGNTTIFEASESVSIGRNFIAEATNNSGEATGLLFIAQVNPNICPNGYVAIDSGTSEGKGKNENLAHHFPINYENGSKVSIYPNPTKDVAHLSVERQGTDAAVIDVFDITGQKILANGLRRNRTNNKDVYVINLTNHAAGVYLIEVTDGDIHEVIKIIKQ